MIVLFYIYLIKYPNIPSSSRSEGRLEAACMTVNEKRRKSKETKPNKSKILLLGEKVLKVKETIQISLWITCAPCPGSGSMVAAMKVVGPSPRRRYYKEQAGEKGPAPITGLSCVYTGTWEVGCNGYSLHQRVVRNLRSKLWNSEEKKNLVKNKSTQNQRWVQLWASLLYPRRAWVTEHPRWKLRFCSSTPEKTLGHNWQAGVGCDGWSLKLRNSCRK